MRASAASCWMFLRVLSLLSVTQTFSATSSAATSTTGRGVHLFTMQKNSLYLRDWVHYHGQIFGHTNMTIIDTDSNAAVKEELKRLVSEYGITVHFRSALGFRDKLLEMSDVMRSHVSGKDNEQRKKKVGGSFLVPLDIDEFIVAVRYGGERFTTFSLQKAAILKMFQTLPVPSSSNKQGGMKYKFNTFEAIDCVDSFQFNRTLNPQIMRKKHHLLTSFVEDKLSYSRCNAKTFYFSEGFIYTDDGNHYGKVMNESQHCFTKYKCKKCYQQFMRSGLGLLHYSSHAMNYHEIKAKMLDRLAVLPHFNNITTLQNCSQFKKNTHYCKFRAQLLLHGDAYMMNKLHGKRQQKCAQEGVFHHSAPAALFADQLDGK